MTPDEVAIVLEAYAHTGARNATRVITFGIIESVHVQRILTNTDHFLTPTTMRRGAQGCQDQFGH